MSYSFDSRLGGQLYQWLPEVYRTRDKQKDAGEDTSVINSLARYLDAHGVLLDQIHATIEQQLKDVSPASSQEWLLPYFAQLVAANIVSPDGEGKHAEVFNAINWRQRKGTLTCAEEIAEAVGQMEVEMHEGWQRVITTPRIGMPLIPYEAVDSRYDLDMMLPSEAAQHPSLPVATVNTRYLARAIEADKTNPAAKVSSFAGARQTWRHANRHGTPCFPGSYEDLSRRTVDVRKTQDHTGRYHHKQLLLFAPPPTGFFPNNKETISWADHKLSKYDHLIEEVEEGTVTVIRNRTNRVIEIEGDISLEAKSYRIEGLNFLGRVDVPAGGTLELINVEAAEVNVYGASPYEEVLIAHNVLFGNLSANALVKLDSCTVVDLASLSYLEATDSIFMAIAGTNITGCLEYCRIPNAAPISNDREKMVIKSHIPDSENEGEYLPVTDDPKFIEGQIHLAARAVLSPSAPESVYGGASDGGEMGYFHNGRQNHPVHVEGDPAFVLPENGGYPLQDLVFDEDVSGSGGPLILSRIAAPKLSISTPLNNEGTPIPSIHATDSLFQSIEAPQGLVRLEYCTVMEEMDCKHIQASDCIFAGVIKNVTKPVPKSGDEAFLNCIRYSSIATQFLEGVEDKPMGDPVNIVARALRLIDENNELTLGTNALADPVFNEFSMCPDGEESHLETKQASYGDRGYGVLGQLTPHTIRFGAENGGEMGAYHHKHYVLKTEAMLAKMSEFLPVGIEPVLIEDERLLHVPPEQIE